MISCKLILKNVRKNMQDYRIYFLTLALAVSLFYAFNSLSDQPAFTEMSMTRALLYDQLDQLLGVLSVALAFVLGFLILYANQFLLRRRKKELGLYRLLGMRPGRIAGVFAAETLCIGAAALAAGLALGFVLSQGVSLAALRLFAVDLARFRPVFSPAALRQTALCFAVIFGVVMVCNVWTVSRVKLIDLLTAGRQNEQMATGRRALPAAAFLLALGCIGTAWVLFDRNGLLPSRENHSFEIAAAALAAGTVLLFYSLAAVFLRAARARPSFYLRGLNAFVVRQIGSRIRTNYRLMAVICGLLTVTICAVSIGTSTALAMNDLARSSTPYDLNVLCDTDRDGDGSIADYLASRGVPMADYAAAMEQISLYMADFTYGTWFSGQQLELWAMDAALPECEVNVVTVSDFNRALALQGKAPVTLGEGQYLVNCNYKGTYAYVEQALQDHAELTVNGFVLQRAGTQVLQETFFMTQMGNNDRGTLIVPDRVAAGLAKDLNVLLVQYRADTDPDEVLQKMIPIGLDDAHSYRYTEKAMMYDMFYGVNALVTFSVLLCRAGLSFDLRGAAGAETADRDRRQPVPLRPAAKAGRAAPADRPRAVRPDGGVLRRSPAGGRAVLGAAGAKRHGTGGGLHESAHRHEHRVHPPAVPGRLRELFSGHLPLLPPDDGGTGGTARVASCVCAFPSGSRSAILGPGTLEGLPSTSERAPRGEAPAFPMYLPPEQERTEVLYEKHDRLRQRVRHDPPVC